MRTHSARSSRSFSRSLMRLGGLALVLAGCSLGASDSPHPRSAPPPAFGTGDVTLSVAHVDDRIGVPTFAWMHGSKPAAGLAATDVAKALLPAALRAFRVKPETASSVVLDRVDEHGTGPIVARFRQEAKGIPVFRGSLNVLLSRALEPVAATGMLTPTLRGTERAFVLAEEDALQIALRANGVASSAVGSKLTKGAYAHYAVPGLRAPARLKRVWFPQKGASELALEPGYYVEVLTKKGPSRSYVVSATDGRVLFTNDLVRADAYGYQVYADPTTKIPYDGPQGNGYAPHPTGVPDKQKLVYVPSQTITLESFPFSKNDPWLPPGATTTTGNNVDAYADLGAPDGFGGSDVRAALTSPGVFGDVYDTTKSPGTTQENVHASITHLFYVINFLHDWFYDAGFDEAAGNHQATNFGRGGDEGDPLHAEAQDYSGRNNANAAVPGDGASPVIQMFVFSGTSSAELVVNTPAPIAGTKSVGLASAFGLDEFDLTGDVVLANDGEGDTADGCQPIEGDLTGKIVLVHRGTCAFSDKAAQVQAAGGVGAIVINVPTSVDPTVPPFMGGTATGITIPVLSLALADGQALEAAIPTGANVTMKRTLGVDVDGGIDTTIVAHEWGHVLSGRLVGDGNGLSTNQSGGLGEGWADFVALMLAARPDDPGNFGGAYANGSYAMSGGGDDIYFGTRRVPYSVDFSKNPLTFKHIANGNALPSGVAPISFGEDGASNAEVHNTGEVWATMLWECYAALLRGGRFTFPEAQERMKRYLVASLAMTPPDPTLLEARDAVLAAALAADPQDFTTFFEAFARRGAGAGAEGPAKDSATNAGVKESFAAGRAATIVGPTVTDDVISCDHDGILDPGEVGTLKLTVKNTGVATLAAPMLRATPLTAGVTLAAEVAAPVDALPPFASKEITVPVRLRGGAPGQVVELAVFVADPELPGGQSEPTKVNVRVAADEAEAAATTDGFETTRTSWRTDSQGAFGPVKWARVEDTGNHYWFISDDAIPADQRLTSAPFTVDAGTFTLAWRHKYAFRRSTRRQQDLDGGVLEISLDGGKVWKDASEYGDVGYPTTIDGARADNALRGRAAFGNLSPGFPDAWTDERVTLTLPAAEPTEVRVRFRFGAGRGFAGTEGWSIDDVSVEGAVTNPFWGFLPHEDFCDENGPTAAASGPARVREGTLVPLLVTTTHPAGLPLFYEWAQTDGPPADATGLDTATPAFTAPDVSVATPLTFEVRANDGALLSAASRVTVTVEPTNYTVGGGCSSTGNASDAASASLLGLGTLLLARRRKRG